MAVSGTIGNAGWESRGPAGFRVRTPFGRGAWIAATLALLAAAPARAASDFPAIDSAHVMRAAHGGGDFQAPLAIAIDTAHREVLVANSGLHRVEFFDYRTYPRGFFVHRVPDGAGGWRDGAPSALAAGADGRIYVSDLYAPFVDVVDYRGRSLGRLELPAPDDAIGGGFGAGAIALAPDGSVLVASRGKQGRIYVFGSDGALRASWGESGREPGRLNAITSLAVTPEGHVLIACVGTELAVQEFDAQGRYLRGFGVHDIGPGNFSFPSGIAVMGDGRRWVCDAIRQVVQVFDPEGKFVGMVGGTGSKPGEFLYPSSMAGNGHDILALAEKGGNRFQVMWVR